MKKALFIITLIVSLFFINNLVRSIFNLWQKQSLLEREKKELTTVKEENKRLKGKLYYVQSTEFIEEQARNKLLLLRPEEQRILISDNLTMATQSGKKSKEENKEANWKKWLRLFF